MAFGRPRKKNHTATRVNNWGYLFIAPALLLYLVFNVWPILRGFLMAFTDYRFIYPDTRWDFNGLSNFSEMLDDKNFQMAVRVTIRWVVYVFPLTIVLSLILAIAISKVVRFAKFYRWMIYLPVILPVAITYLMFGEVFNNKFGLINAFLRSIGIRRPPAWLSDPDYVLQTLGSADIWKGIGFPTLLFLIGIYSIGSDIFEASSIDGASGWQQIRSITIPLLKPVFALIFLLGLSTIPMVIDPMLILTQGGPQYQSTTVGLYAYQSAFQIGDLRLGYAAAMNLLLGVSCGIAGLVIFRMMRGEVDSGRPEKAHRFRRMPKAEDNDVEPAPKVPAGVSQ